MAPAISEASTTIIVTGHLQPIFPDRPGHHNVIDLPSGAVIQHIVCAAGRTDTFESTRHADWIVIVKSEQWRAARCKQQNEKELFHFAQDKWTAGCLSVGANP
jgi:hypothetical protein